MAVISLSRYNRPSASIIDRNNARGTRTIRNWVRSRFPQYAGKLMTDQYDQQYAGHGNKCLTGLPKNIAIDDPKHAGYLMNSLA